MLRQASEEEKRRLERRVSEQMEVLKRKQQEYSRLKAGSKLFAGLEDRIRMEKCRKNEY